MEYYDYENLTENGLPKEKRRKPAESPDDERLIYLIEVMFSKSDALKYYTYWLEGIQTFFLIKGKGIIFSETHQGLRAYDKYIPQSFLGEVSKIPTMVDASFSFYQISERIASKVEIDNGSTVDSLNLIFDMLRECEAKVPSIYKEKMYELANYLTFNRNIRKFLSRLEPFEESVLHDALNWSVGYIVLNSIFVK